MLLKKILGRVLLKCFYFAFRHRASIESQRAVNFIDDDGSIVSRASGLMMAPERLKSFTSRGSQGRNSRKTHFLLP